MHSLFVSLALLMLNVSTCSCGYIDWMSGYDPGEAYKEHPKLWFVGLRNGHTLENHFDTIGRQIPVEQYVPLIKPEHHGYAALIADDDFSLFGKIRSDPNVGFIVQKPRGFFLSRRETLPEKLIPDWVDEDKVEEEIEVEIHECEMFQRWAELQDCDSEISITDGGKR